MTDRLALDPLTLHSGAHSAPWDVEDLTGVQACVMEAVSFVAGEPWSDHPQCASRVIGAYLRSWNDALPTEERQQLKRYIPRLVGSAGTAEQEERRSWMALDWLIRTHAPAWLRLAGLDPEATVLAGLDEITSAVTLGAATEALSTARQNAAAAWVAARDAAWAAARAAARDAAWDAARDAARAVARAAARDAAWAATWDAARDAAWAVARDAAWAATRDAAWAATWDAARDAARDALRSTVEELQVSSHDLVDRMLKVTES